MWGMREPIMPECGSRALLAPLFAVLGLAGLEGCAEADRPDLMRQARRVCLHLAMPHVSGGGQNRALVYSDVPNTASDPTHNTFEFIWGDDGTAEPDQSIQCQGHASGRAITIEKLLVSGRNVVTLPYAY
ncbi:hypothetical protein MOX02_47990 [Methylobacterium oxalidis]|uniref:Uncharacterized protein n=1 Tax=Methylobacterium oxalidis TaxID=944322 RepID=A0A512J9Z5_9HYPH|nr:hypothetical protein MOX02_47990 [Methylobacterium oxalidis]GJE35591.1 hypothetical protein LDDCCGHA_5810 [Methylobacterium oxalidis]GLS67969.1 hypothetical protein GCM10007888_63540 [Methylobacterium oxalidis]